MAVPPSIKPMYVWWVCRVQWWVWQAGRCGLVTVLALLSVVDVMHREVCLVTEGVGGGLVEMVGLHVCCCVMLSMLCRESHCVGGLCLCG
jgi:hypothetical protein